MFLEGELYMIIVLYRIPTLGLYLFLQVQLPLSLATIRHLHFLIIGWGCPAVNMLVWGGIRLGENDDTGTDDTSEDGVEMTRD